MFSRRSKLSFILSITLGVIVLLGVFGYAQAANRWIKYKSETGLFSVGIPNEFTDKNHIFHNSSDSILQSGELISTIDQRPYKNAVKHYIVTYEQTLGAPLTYKEIEVMIKEEQQIYEEYYKPLNGVVKETDINLDSQLPYGKIYLTYEDPELGLQGVKAQIKFSGKTKIHQVVTSPAHTMASKTIVDFISSLKLFSGVAVSDDPLENHWDKYTSPMGLFSLYLPPISEIYAPTPPAIESNGSSEAISFAFSDPVRKENLFYRSYGHRFKQPLNVYTAKRVLFKRHIGKHGKRFSNTEFKTSTLDGNIKVFETDYKISGIRGLPHVKAVKIRAFLKGPNMVVQEIMGSEELVYSQLSKTVFDLTEVHLNAPPLNLPTKAAQQ